MIRAVLALSLLLCAMGPSAAAPAPVPATPAPPAAADQKWLFSDDKALLVPARVALPRRAGNAAAFRHDELSEEGQWIDNVLRYRSEDEEVGASVYLYYTGLAHSGLAAIAADHFAHGGTQSPVAARESRIVDAGKFPRSAIRVDFPDSNGRASGMAVIKAGRWIIRILASAPSARRGEAEATLTALLRGIEIGPASPVHEAAPIKVKDCAPGRGSISAKPLPDPAPEQLAAYGFLATFDGGGIEAVNERGERDDLPSRIPPELCLSSVSGGMPILRAEPGPPLSVDGRTMLVALVNDGGTILEVVHVENLHRYQLLYHAVGLTYVLGSFDGVPSDSQIVGILSYGNSAAARVRVPVTFRPGRGPAMSLPSLRSAPPAQPLPTT
jgi:hypothetical protein